MNVYICFLNTSQKKKNAYTAIINQQTIEDIGTNLYLYEGLPKVQYKIITDALNSTVK